MSRSLGRCVVAAVVLAGIVVVSTGQEPVKGLRLASSDVPAAEWPAYRRDPGLTGFSPLVGGLAEAPHKRWMYDLGGASTSTEQVQLVDVNAAEMVVI
jgi:hypothetical protein